MENKQTTYKYDEEADKHYFAGFFNLAWNNIEIGFKVFQKKFQLSTSEPIPVIDNYFKDDLALTDYQDRIDFLKQYFPVIEYLDLSINDQKLNPEIGKERENKRRNCFRANFKLLIKAIKELRNYYTHHYHKPIILDQPTFTLLDELFLAVVKEVKKYKMKGENVRHLFKRELKDELSILINLKKK